MVVVAVLSGLVAGGVVAGAVCWKRRRHLVGLTGLLAPVLPLVGHYLALALGPTDVWAPTMAGDLIAIAAAIAASVVALAGASIAPEPRAV